MHVVILIVRNLARGNARLVTQAGGNAVQTHARYRAGRCRRCVCVEFVAVLVACSRAHHGRRGVELRLIGSRQRLAEHLCHRIQQPHPVAPTACLSPSCSATASPLLFLAQGPPTAKLPTALPA
jgi:hypothetical protein